MKNLSKISIIPSLLLFPPLSFFLHAALCFPPSLPHTRSHTHLNFLPFSPSSAAIVLYRLQLTTSQVGLRDILDHGGASQLTQRLQPAPRLQSQAPLRPCPRQGRETPGQTAETLPAADCLMLTTERIQAKGGGAHQELQHHQRHFSGLFHVYCSSQCRTSVHRGRARVEQIFSLLKCLHCVTIKVPLPLKQSKATF